MIGFFKRRQAANGTDTSALGSSLVALRMAPGSSVPPACVGLVFDQRGCTRRVAPGARLSAAATETAYCFHPGPYALDLAPFPAAPEIGLRVAYAVDSADPRVTQQRFDLFLMSEAGPRLDAAVLGAAIETAVQRELAQGNLELPPCTTLDEWNAFRAGFNQLLYTRFGVSVDDCVPVDLGRDYAQMLLARTAYEAAPAVAAPVPSEPSQPDVAGSDARALRRLFLELPCVMCGLRLAVLPQGQELFRQQQALLQRLDQVSLSVTTMPALELAAPGQPLAAGGQARRARHSLRAVAALDEAWALLARLEHAGPGQLAAMFDDADRIVANLECDSGARRLAVPGSETP
jgi:hypothetical protein